MSNFEWHKYLNTYFPVVISAVVFLSLVFWILSTFFKHYPVNCWFCQCNSRVPFKERNSWFCQNCLQYNGFTENGDYNKSLYQNMQPSKKVMYNYNKYPPRPASNGLCHKCNINQQLKVMQLANFKPMYKNKFDEEVEEFKIHLEDVYKLCKRCKKFLNSKLQREKGTFLNPKQNVSKSTIRKQSEPPFSYKVQSFLKGSSIRLTYMFLVIVLMVIYFNANLFFSRKIMRLMRQHVDNVYNVAKSNLLNEKLLAYTFPCKEIFRNMTLVNYTADIVFNHSNYNTITKYFMNDEDRMLALDLCLRGLVVSGLTIQIILLLLECGRSFRLLLNSAIWILSGYLLYSEDKHLMILQPILSFVVLWSMKTIQTSKKTDLSSSINSKIWKNMKSLSNVSHMYNDDELISEDSDFEDPGPANRTSTPDYYNHFYDDKSQITRPYGFRVDNIPNQSFSSCNLPKSNFSVYQANSIPYTSELDQGFGTLSLENKKSQQYDRSHNLFSPKTFSSPNNVITSSSSRRPVISPGRFVYSTQSWVAGGYWGSENPKKMHPSHDNSRSSSQSSGFESITSGNHKSPCSVPSVYDYQFRKVPNYQYMGQLGPDKLNTSFSNKGDNIFRNFNTMSTLRSPPCKTLFSSNDQDCAAKLDNSKLLSEYSFVTPNPKYSFVPLEKPKS